MIFVFEELPWLGHHEPTAVIQANDIESAIEFLRERYNKDKTREYGYTIEIISDEHRKYISITSDYIETLDLEDKDGTERVNMPTEYDDTFKGIMLFREGECG